MGRGWSAAARVARRQRAAQRGYVVPKPRGFTFLAVDTALAKRGAQVLRGLGATRAVEIEVGLHRRSSSDLALAAATALGSERASAFPAVTKHADAAKHRTWLPSRTGATLDAFLDRPLPFDAVPIEASTLESALIAAAREDNMQFNLDLLVAEWCPPAVVEGASCRSLGTQPERVRRIGLRHCCHHVRTASTCDR